MRYPLCMPQKFAYASMGTQWEVTVWDDVSTGVMAELENTVIRNSAKFDNTFSRFKTTSLVWDMARKPGITKVPADLVRMLRLYEKLSVATDKQCNPLIGFALSDLGYDKDYSLREQAAVRPVPDFQETLRIADDTHVELRAPALIDLGALGKGYFVDVIAALLKQRGLRRFLVNGSGDMYYSGDGESIRAGLEHPEDPSKVIGVLEMKAGCLCASGSNRRRWGKHHHIINPQTWASPEDILGTWVLAESAAVADALATCLFLTEPERLREHFAFEYCMVNASYTVRRSEGFHAELF